MRDLGRAIRRLFTHPGKPNRKPLSLSMRKPFLLYQLVVLSICMTGPFSLAADRPCLSSSVGRYCEGDTVYGLAEGGGYKGSTISAISEADQKVMWNGVMTPLTQLATLSRGGCYSAADSSSPERPRVRYDGTNRTDSPVCPGDRIKDRFSEGIAIGKFANGDLLFSDGKTSSRRVPAYNYKRQNGEALSQHDLQLVAQEAEKVNEVLAGINSHRLNHCRIADAPQPVTLPNAKRDQDCKPGAAEADLNSLPQKKYFENLLAKGSNAPLDDFLKFWLPQDGKPIDSTYFNCEKSENGPFKVPVDGKFPEGCRPDVLYSWGPQKKMEAITGKLKTGAKWEGTPNPFTGGLAHGAVFTTISPVSTFGYGSNLIRFKIKPGAAYNGRGYGGEDGEVSIRSSTYNYYNDFVLKDASLIESYSYGTPEIYDELVREIRRYRADKRVSVYQVLDAQPSGIERLWAQAADGNEHDEAGLKENLLEVIRQILSGEGRIVFNEGACENRSRHYSTAHPNFIVPFSSATER